MTKLKRQLTLILLVSGFFSEVYSQTGGGNCLTDAQCNFPIGGACAGGSNSCVCFNGYTGAFCQTAPPAPSPETSPSSTSSNNNNAILLISLASLFFWYLSKERSRQEEDWVFYRTFYQQELLNLL
uniref:Uncharacterized protein LOC111137904 n=1 Tax=Crassostrea virginica TaxID=6565 RepID=A0A8B8EZA0_CRAVI|nr:uncharacterized protein LOC111137904 [Crassostrea virginica]XP_022345316.1 uncharacterized protein LOC111137904 [Crassostrea virginica]